MKVRLLDDKDLKTAKATTSAPNNSDPMCREVDTDSPDKCKRCALGFYLKNDNKEC